MAQESGIDMPQAKNPQQPLNPEHQEGVPKGPVKPVSSEEHQLRQFTEEEIREKAEEWRNLPVGVKRALKDLAESAPLSHNPLTQQRMSFEDLGWALQSGDPHERAMAIAALSNNPDLEAEVKAPEQKAVKSRREESKGVKAFNLISRVGIANLAISNEMDVLDSLLGNGFPLEMTVQRLMDGMENILRMPNIADAEKNMARQSIREAINEEIESQRPQRREFADKIKRVENLRDGDQKTNEVGGLLKEFSPQKDYLPPELIKLAMVSDQTFDYMVNKIISLPLSHETANYQLGLTSSVNLELIASVVNDEKNLAGDEGNAQNLKRYSAYSEKLSQAQDSFRLLHEMNRLIRSGELDQFLQTAGGITPEHFNYLQKVSGVSATMRLYEQAYDEFHTENGWILSEKMEELNMNVFENLRHLNSKGLFGKKLEEWELTRAHAIAGKLYNISLRSPEKIATGTVPRELAKKEKLARANEIQRLKQLGRIDDANKLRKEMADAEMLGKHRYSSFPFESMGRIMNPVQLLIWRFEVGKDAQESSMEFLKVVKRYYKKSLEDKGEKLGKNKITTLGGINVEEMEIGGLTGVSGVYSGWRQENMLISQMKTGERTVQDWLAHNSPEIELAREAKDGERLRKVLRPLINSVNAGRGILLRQPPFGEEVGYLARQLLWEKIAEENLPLMVNYLSGIKFGEGAQNVPQSLNEIVRNVGGGINLKEFRQKVMLEHEIKMRQTARNSRPQLFDGQPPDIVLPADFYLPSEQRLKEAVVAAGKQLAPHLADIAFPYTAFLNDSLFEVFDYRVAGHEFYRRRLAGDTPSYNKASGAFTGIIDNPGVKPEDILTKLHEMQRGIESPNGREDGQKRTFPVVEAYLEWIMTRPGERHVALKGIKQSLLKHTSEAQRYSGMEAPSVNEDQARKIIEHLEQQAVLSVSLAEDLKKKKNLKLAGLFFAMFRDLFTTLIPVALLYSIGKESAKVEK